MNIAVLGGRFDPVHNGHVAIANEILRVLPGIGEVWLIPANTHPWKQIIAPADDRLAMLSKVKGRRMRISDIDIRRGGDTFTIDTVRELQKDKSNTFYWVIGSDQIADFPKWKDAILLQHLIQFLVFPREGYEQVALPGNFSLVEEEIVAPAVSSSEIRERIKNNEPITDLVPKNVEDYIRQKRLYQ